MVFSCSFEAESELKRSSIPEPLTADEAPSRFNSGLIVSISVFLLLLPYIYTRNEWLLVAELISKSGKSLSQLVHERQKAFPCSGEINYKVSDVPVVLDKVLSYFTGDNPKLDKTDGISLDFGSWRMNIRSSNTEPLLRLNVESRGDKDLVRQKVSEIEVLINEC